MIPASNVHVGWGAVYWFTGRADATMLHEGDLADSGHRNKGDMA